MGATRFSLLLVLALLIGQGSAELIKRNYPFQGLLLAFGGGGAVLFLAKTDD